MEGRAPPPKKTQPPKKSPKPDNSNFKGQPQWIFSRYIYLEMAKNTCGLANDATVPEVKLDLSDDELAEAAVRREAMYQRATLAL